MSTVLGSYNASICSNPKRKLEESGFEVCEAKQFAFDAAETDKFLPTRVSVSRKENSDYHIVEKYIGIEKISEVTPRGTITHQGINTNNTHQNINTNNTHQSITNNKEDKNKDRIIAELVAEMIRDEKSFIPSNFQPYNDVPGHLEVKEIGSLNSQAETIDENPQIISNSEKNLIWQQLDNISVYSYSNFTFLYLFLHFPSSSFTAESIRIRFSSGFLNFLSIDQLIRALVILLSGDLVLTESERTELVEMIFGHIDFSLKMCFNNGQIVSIVTALLLSDVPHCFEQVFLTWKMWKVFTTEEQGKMLEGVVFNIIQDSKIRIKYDRETLVMLYLFVLNKDATNSNMCEVLKDRIIKIYGRTHIFNAGEDLSLLKYIEKKLSIADTLDTSLLDLPNALKFFNDHTLLKFKEYIRLYMGTMRGPLYFACFGKRYKVHICYVLTKFTFDNVQGSDKVVIDVYDRMYFEPKYIKSIFNKWAKISKDESSIPDERNVNEFKNAYNAMRQIVQSDGYDSVAFLRLFHTISGNNVADKMFALILFSLTKENILRDVNKTPEWTEYVKNRNTKRHKFAYIENIFMYNANLSLKLSESYCPYGYIKIVTKILLNLINTNQALYRERYLYQQLLFQPKFEPFNNSKMNLYIFGLNDIGQLDNKERRIQIARDLMFNKFYLKSAVELKTRLIGNEKNLEELRMRIEMEYKRYENEACLESERKAIENC